MSLKQKTGNVTEGKTALRRDGIKHNEDKEITTTRQAKGMIGARATVGGAISIVNAIATKKGATVGIDLKVSAEIRAYQGGRGISVIRTENRSLSSRLIQKTIKHTVPKDISESHRFEVRISSEIPAGFGLKSSSAISSAVALACSHAFKLRLSDRQILLAGINASIESKVSITGAYDDACSCYYGGYNITDNARRAIIRHQRAPTNMNAVIFIPKNPKRGNPKKLSLLRPVFDEAWNIAKKADYWKAMAINGLAVASILGSTPDVMTNMIQKGAIAVSVSGNGPSIAAVVKNEDVQNVKRVLAGIEGKIIVAAFSNRKAKAHDLV